MRPEHFLILLFGIYVPLVAVLLPAFVDEDQLTWWRGVLERQGIRYPSRDAAPTPDGLDRSSGWKSFAVQGALALLAGAAFAYLL